MKTRLLILIIPLLFGMKGWGQFSNSNLAILVTNATLNNTTVSVVEINKNDPNQTAIRTIPIPGTGDTAIRVSGSATSTLYAASSADRSLFCFTGHNSTNTSSNANTLNPRAVVTINNAGDINIATTYTGTSGSQTRCATTLNNTNFYIADQGGQYTNGSTSPSPSGNFRGMKTFGGVVYVGRQSATSGVTEVATTSALTGGTITGLPGLTNNNTHQDFYLISSGSNGSDFDILYITRNTSATAGTIAKFSLVSGTWTANGTYTTNFGGFGLAAEKSGSGAVLFVSTGNGATAANSVRKLTDAAGYNQTINITENIILYTAAAGMTIKGLDFAPQGYTWTGATNSNWIEATNWNNGIPDGSMNVYLRVSPNNPSISTLVLVNNLIIHSGVSLFIENSGQLTVAGTLTNNGSLTIKSDASGTGSLIHSMAGVTATVERYVSGHGNLADAGWHLLGSPVATFDIAGTSFEPGTNDDLYAWSEVQNLWLNYKATGGPTQIIPGTGYLIAYENNSTKSFAGNLNVTDINISGLSLSSGANSGWHLLGNPFASALQWNNGYWALSNVAGIAKIWNSVSKAYSDILPNGIIPSANGFFVQVDNSSNGLIIPASARIHNNTAWYKNDLTRIVLSASPADGSSKQESQIVVEPQATAGYDFYYDSRFMAGYAPRFYSIAGNEKLSTNALPELHHGNTIPFGFVKNQHIQFVIRLEEGIAGETLLLKDLKLNTMHNLSLHPEYLFTSAPGDEPNRFLLVYGTVGIDEVRAGDVLQASMQHGQLYINNQAKNSLVSIHDLSGRLLYERHLDKTGLHQIPTGLKPGVYIIRLQSAGNTLSNKVINF